MLPDRVSNLGPLTYESGALPIALRGPAPLTREGTMKMYSCFPESVPIHSISQPQLPIYILYLYIGQGTEHISNYHLLGKILTLLHSERPKLYRVLAVLSAIV